MKGRTAYGRGLVLMKISQSITTTAELAVVRRKVGGSSHLDGYFYILVPQICDVHLGAGVRVVNWSGQNKCIFTIVSVCGGAKSSLVSNVGQLFHFRYSCRMTVGCTM